MKKNIFLLSSLFVLCILFAGCATTKNIMLTSHFDSNIAKSMLEQGDNTIKGSALIRQRGGGVVTCAGSEVVLIPATDYARERIRAIYGNEIKGYAAAGFGHKQVKFDPSEPEYFQLMKKTIGDAQGYFSFPNIKDGNYFVVTCIAWKVNDYFYEGGNLMQYVAVSDGETKEIVLAP